VLAGIGQVETRHGSLVAPGVLEGANFAGAEGPMQMEPGTFARYAQPVPADPAPTPAAGVRPPSPYDPTDAIYAAARMLCAANVATDEWGALYAYNHAGWYVSEVLGWSQRYGQTAAGASGPVAMLAVQYALSVVGTPYRWGGDTPTDGFDCSGLAQWAFAQTGVALPRVAQAQQDATAPAAPGTPLAPGNLVFFGAGPQAVDHVGIYVGNGQMVDAPHTGATVRIEPVAGFTPRFVDSGTPVPGAAPG
jgi:cell wall-associated NlpC family hydrolase